MTTFEQMRAVQEAEAMAKLVSAIDTNMMPRYEDVDEILTGSFQSLSEKEQIAVVRNLTNLIGL